MRHSVVAAAVVGLASAIGAFVAHAGPEKIVFPANFASGVLYATVDRPDAKQHRELYASQEAVRAAREGKPMPSGTVITEVLYRAVLDARGNPTRDANGRFQKGDLAGYVVMEKRAGWGAEYSEDLRNGEWEYAVFAADKQLNPKANLKACFECHKPHSKADFVLSMPMLAGGQVTVKPQQDQ